MFAQHIERVVPLTWDQVDVGPTKVSIALGKTVIEIPQPLYEPFRELAAAAPSNTAARRTQLGVSRLRPRPAQSTPPHSQNASSGYSAPVLPDWEPCTSFTKLAPIADALGYTTQSFERHARGATATYAEYVATRQ